MIHPMQYELERASHAQCEGSAARQRQIAEAARRVATGTRSAASEYGIGVRRCWLLLMRRAAPLPGAQLTRMTGPGGGRAK